LLILISSQLSTDLLGAFISNEVIKGMVVNKEALQMEGKSPKCKTCISAQCGPTILHVIVHTTLSTNFR